MNFRLVNSIAVFGLAVGLAGRAQVPPPALTTAPCVPTKKEPCLTQTPPPAVVKKPAEEFPFPGDAPAAPDAKKAAEEFPFPGDAAPVQKPAVDTPAGAAAEHPFPEDGGGSSSSSSSSSSSTSSSGGNDGPEMKDEGSEGSTKASRRRMPKTEDPVTRELEDLKVSRYYSDTGNFKGAYMRAQDAVKYQPDDPEAHLQLAEMALKLQKKDEAVAEFKAFLTMDPDPDQAKLVRKKLDEMK